jgi:hypothetical protein
MPVPDLIAEGENIRWYSDSLLTNQVYSGNVFPTGITQIGNYHYYYTIGRYMRRTSYNGNLNH